MLHGHPRIIYRWKTIGSIPEGKLREFRAEARLVLSQPIDLEDLTPFANLSVFEFLRQPAYSLIEGSDIPLKAVIQWQSKLDNLHMALDEAHSQQIKLGELISA